MAATSKRKRVELDLKMRFVVVKYSQDHPQGSTRKLAEKLKCGKTQIQNILKNKEEILKNFEANVSSSLKTSRGAKHEDVDIMLLNWFQRARSKNMPITGPMLQEKAMQIANALGRQPEEFKASNGWLDRFKTRNGIKAKVISGEAGDMNEETV